MFERFTAPARAIVIDSQAVARRLRHERVGTEHLLLALLASATLSSCQELRSAGLTPETAEADLVALVGPPTAERDRAALAALGIDVDRVREAVEATFGRGALSTSRPDRRRRHLRWPWTRPRRPAALPGAGRRVPFSPRAKKSLELSLREALRLNHRFIAPEHLALGILREGEGLACALLARRGVSFAALRRSLESAIRPAA
jgi:ATP-dependent Clp protease ATP-binding subunit ClpA